MWEQNEYTTASKIYLKGHNVILEKKWKLWILMFYNNTNSKTFIFFHKWINKLFSEEDKVPTTLFEARKVAGSAKYKQIKQYEIVSFKVTVYTVDKQRVCCTM